jgi:hypothetical protein
MAKRVTNEDILVFNEIYYKTKNYTQVARETGFSASTVRKYIDKNWEPVAAENIIHFDIAQLPDFTGAVKIFRGVDNYGYLCQLTPVESEEIKELWKELVV